MSTSSHIVPGLSICFNERYQKCENAFFNPNQFVVVNVIRAIISDLLFPLIGSVMNVWDAGKAIVTFRYFKKEGISVGLLYSGGAALKIVSSPLHFLAMECVSIASLGFAFLAIIPSLIVGKNWSKTILLSGLTAMSEFSNLLLAPKTYLERAERKGREDDLLAEQPS